MDLAEAEASLEAACLVAVPAPVVAAAACLVEEVSCPEEVALGPTAEAPPCPSVVGIRVAVEAGAILVALAGTAAEEACSVAASPPAGPGFPTEAADHLAAAAALEGPRTPVVEAATLASSAPAGAEAASEGRR